MWFRRIETAICGPDLPKTGDESEVEVKDILQPLDGSSRLVGQDLDEVRTGLVTGRLEGIVVELLDAVTDFVVDLGAGQSTVDTRSCLCGVATKEAWRRKAMLVAHVPLKRGMTLNIGTYPACQGQLRCHQRDKWCEQRSGRKLGRGWG